MPVTTVKIDIKIAIEDLANPDDSILHDKARFLEKKVEEELMKSKSSGHSIKDEIRKVGKAVGATTKEERIQESLIHLGGIILSTFIVLNPLSLNAPDEMKKVASVTLSSLTYPPNIKHLQENLRSIFEIKEQEK